jgi:hypothetical protein
MRFLGNVLLLFLAATLISGCGHSPSGSAEQAASPGGGGATPASVAKGPVPNFDTEPLTDADVTLYLDVMKAAADYVKNPSPSDKAAMDLMHQVNSGKITSAVTPEQAQMMARVATLAQYDMEIAKQRGISDRYEAIRGQIEGMIGMTACPSCSGDGGGPVSQDQKELVVKEQAARKTDMSLLEPHRAEIESLQKQVRGVLMNGPDAH